MSGRPVAGLKVSVEHAGSRTPEKAGVEHEGGEASPFSIFAEHLSPITPTRAANAADDWQPHYMSPSRGAGVEGRPGASSDIHGNAETHSGGKSSLRSSYETVASSISHILAAEQDPSSAVPRSGDIHTGPATESYVSGAPQQAGSILESLQSYEQHREQQGQEAQAASLRGTGLHDAGASKQTDPSDGNRPSLEVTLPSPSRSGGSPHPQGASTSPFASLAAEQPPAEWGPASEKPNSAKRKQSQPDDAPRPRKRQLTFPPSTRPSEPSPPAEGLSALCTQPAQPPMSQGGPGAARKPAQGGTAYPTASMAYLTPGLASTSQPANSAAGLARTGFAQSLPLFLCPPYGMPFAGQTPGQAAAPPAGTVTAPGVSAHAAVAAPPPASLPGVPPPPTYPSIAPLSLPQSALAAVLAAGPISRPQVSTPQGAALAAATTIPIVQRRQPGSGAAGMIRRPPSNKKAEKEAAAAAGQKRCNCKKSRCLKLYCDCFAAGQFCTACTCQGCSNTPDCRDAVMEMRETIQARNHQAFDTRVIQTVETAPGRVVNQHKRGCHCKKSNCKKKYCECFQAGVNCGQHCKCENCHNQAEHGPPESKKGGSKAAKGGAEGAARVAKDSPAVGAEKTKPPAKPKKRGAAAPEGEEPVLVDTRAKPQGPNMTLLEGKAVPGFEDVKEASLPPLNRPIGRALSALPDLSVLAQGRAPAPVRTCSGSLLSGGPPSGLKAEDAAAVIVKDEDDFLCQPFTSTGFVARPGLIPDGPLGTFQDLPPPSDLHLRLGLPAALPAAGGLLADLDSPDLANAAMQSFPFELEKELPDPNEAGRPQVLPSFYYGPPEQFGSPQEEGMGPPEPILGPTQWTENRLDDLETGEEMQFNLEEAILMSADMHTPPFEDQGFLLGPELDDVGGSGQDENVEPLHALRDLAAQQNLLPLTDSPKDSPLQLKTRTGSFISQSRSPFSHSQRASVDSLLGPEDDSGAGGRGEGLLGLESLPSLNPGGLPALRQHRPDPPALPEPILKRARSGEIFQEVLDSDLQAAFLPGANLHGEDGLFALSNLDAAAMAASLALPPPKRSRPNTPSGERAMQAMEFPSPGFDQTGGLPDLTGQDVGLTFKLGPASGKHHATSPQRSRYVRSGATSKAGNSGFLRLSAGSTIFSPTKQG